MSQNMSPATDPAAEVATGAAQERPFTLLCVDDETNILSALRRLFRPHGYRVLIAGSGADGLELLAEEQVDLVISDMRMPEMDGAQFLAQVRTRYPDVVRILLTGYADMQSTVAAINEGRIARYISKPWNDEEVLFTVREALERKVLEREKARLEELTRRQNDELKALNAGLEQKVEERTAEVRNAHEKLKQNFVTSIKVFSNLIELRGGPLAGHSRRVADLARKIAVRMGFSGPDVQDVMLAGLLHDIGKIGLPDHLLAKPLTHMTGDELGQMRRHPVTGQNALMALDALGNVAAIVRSHHERWDGEGYPDALKETAIPPGGRILAVANDYDGMQIGIMSPRLLKPEEARDMIRQGRGKRYDPQVVDAFLEVLNKEANTNEVSLPPAQLKPGMVLSRDLLSRDGVLLLAADFTLDAGVIRQIRDFEHSENTKLSVFIRTDRARSS